MSRKNTACRVRLADKSAGYTRTRPARPALSTCAALLFWLASIVPGLPQTSAVIDGSPRLLTNAMQVVALGTNITEGRYIASLECVVHYISAPSRRLYVQQGDVGVQVNCRVSIDGFQVGQKVLVSGDVLGGLPVVRIANATPVLMGEAPLPDATLVSARRLVQGENSYRHVAVHSIVRDMTSTSTGLILLVTQGSLAFEVVCPGNNLPLPKAWLDAEIEARGFAYPNFNSEKRVTSFRFYLADTNYVRVLSPGIPEPFEGRPLMTIAEAAKLTNSLKARVRVGGTVTVCRPGIAFYIDDGTGVMMVDTMTRFLSPPVRGQHLEREPQTPVKPGERVEVIGARHNWFAVAPSMMISEYRRLGRTTEVQPIAVTLDELMNGRHAGRLVKLKARLVDQRAWSMSNLRHYLELILLGDGDIFQARWESDTPVKWNLETDTYVSITGVNDAEGGPNRKRTTFKLLLRSPADVVAATPPPFWTRTEFRRLATAVGGVVLLAGAALFFQRWQMGRLEHRVVARTADLSNANLRLQEEVAARERAEKEVHRALSQEKQLSELKSRFVAMVSHEFRTPLGIITSSAEILDAYLDRLSTAERHSNLRDITDATRHMSRMMEEVLLLGRVEAGKMTCRPAPLDLTVFGQRLIDEVSSATNNRCAIRLTAAPDLGEVQADEGLLRHIFTNLLNNAAKYSPAGGVVEFQFQARDHLVVFTVRDSGIGIPESDAKLIFQAFHRGSNVGDTPGTGLGMTIVKRCVELHGGKIAFESKEGRGTTFVVALPLLGVAAKTGDHTTQIIRAAVNGDLTLIS